MAATERARVKVTMTVTVAVAGRDCTELPSKGATTTTLHGAADFASLVRNTIEVVRAIWPF